MKVVQYLLIALVRLYRGVLSPTRTFIIGPMARCRFEPSCSAYALEAIKVHGAWRGGFLAAKRVCRCHPWGDFGPDPVPTPTGLELTTAQRRPLTHGRLNSTAALPTPLPARRSEVLRPGVSLIP